MHHHLIIIIPIAVLLFFVSMLYSSVGHGGASGYLAILSPFSFLPNEIESHLINLIYTTC